MVSDVDLHKNWGETALIQEPLSLQIGVLGHAVWNLGFHLILPFRLSVLYPHGDSSSVLAVLAGLPFLALVVLYLLRSVLSVGNFVAVAIATLLVGFSLNWFDASRLSNVTDNTSYLAIIPLVAIIVAGASKVKLPGPSPQTVVGVTTVVLILLGGFAWHRTSAFDSSVALWSDVLRKDPQSSFAEASLAEQLRLAAIEDEKAGDKDQVKLDVDQVIQHADSALKLDPSNSQAERTWANVLVSEGEIVRAVSHFEHAISLDPTNVQLRDEYASSLNELGRFKDAIPQLDESLRMDAKSGTTHLLLGEAYYGLGNMDRAMSEQTMALEFNPGDLLARQKLAEAQAKAGAFKEAIANYSVMMQASPEQMNRPELWKAIAEIKDRQGDYGAAVQYLEPALKLAPDDAGLKTELDNEKKKQAHAAATRAATMPATR